MNALSPLSLATPAPAPAVTARVLSREGEALVIAIPGGEASARRAFSCLVQPEPGDIVLLAHYEDEAHVLAILQREGPAPLCLAIAGDGELAASGQLALRAETLVLAAPTGRVLIDDLALTGKSASARFGRIALVAESVENFVTRMLSRLTRSYRFVEETEQLRAQNIDQRATGHLHLRGQTAALHAGVVVKLDAAQIHMG